MTYDNKIRSIKQLEQVIIQRCVRDWGEKAVLQFIILDRNGKKTLLDFTSLKMPFLFQECSSKFLLRATMKDIQEWNLLFALKFIEVC